MSSANIPVKQEDTFTDAKLMEYSEYLDDYKEFSKTLPNKTREQVFEQYMAKNAADDNCLYAPWDFYYLSTRATARLINPGLD